MPKLPSGKVRVKFTNNYDDGHECSNVTDVNAPASEPLDEWWQDTAFQFTGCGCRSGGKPEGNAVYSAVILEANDPALVGKTNEWA
jgi:hypothetical protein